MSTAWNSEDWFWKRTATYSAIAVAVVAAGGAFYYFKVLKQDAPPAETPPVAEAPEAPLEEPVRDHHPIPTPEAPAKPLPRLAESDGEIAQDLTGVVGKRPIEEMLVPDNVIRHFVVTIDNLPRNKVAEQMRPVKPVGGRTLVETRGETITLSPENSARYAAVMKIVESTDTKQLGDLYIRYYPLFQEAYEDLGYPGQYFNDRLVEVIDHLLQTPDLRGPIELKQGRVFYEFADPSLEARSAGQKLLLRMGSENAAKIKEKLRDLRVVVTTSRDPPESATSTEGAGTTSSEPAAAPTGDAPTVRPDTVPEAEPAR